MMELFQAVHDGSQINLLIAFLAGIVAFFASCLLPLVPTYLAYLSGISLTTNTKLTQRWRLVRIAGVFAVGFIIAFLILGLSLRSASVYLYQYQDVLQLAAGIIFVLLGLFVLGIYKSTFLAQERKWQLGSFLEKYPYWHALVVGLVFGLGWTPCIGPVLAVILYWSSQVATQAYGMVLLLVFGVGLGLPFVIIAAGFEKLLPVLQRYKKVSYYTTIFAGTLILLTGIVLLVSLVTPVFDIFFRFLPSY